MRPPVTALGGTAGIGTLAGLGANYTPDADGNYTITFWKDVDACQNAGWTVVKPGDVGPDLFPALTGIAPSATLNTYGAVTTIAPSADFASLKPLSCDIVFAGTFGSETLTVKILVTFNDATTQTSTAFTATGTGTTAMTLAQIRNTFYKAGVAIASIALSCASSLGAGSSVALFGVNMHILQAGAVQ
jgi:hypothetical protein